MNVDSYLECLQRDADIVAQNVAAFQRPTSQERFVGQDGVEMLDQILAQLCQTVSRLSETVSQVRVMRSDAFQELRRRRNRSVLVNTLPVEIMAMIFQLVVGDRKLSFVHPYELPPDSLNVTALRLTHVCHHWRGFAQQLPLLWNTIIVKRRTPTSPRAGVQVHMHALRLAADAPLHIVFESFHSVSSRIKDALAAQREQLRSLYIFNITYSDQADIIRFIEATQLQTLCLADAGSDHWPAATFTKFMAPALQHLRVASVPPPWNSGFTNLTRLIFDHQRSSTTTDWIEGLLALLDRNPSIYEIDISDCWLSPTAQQDDNLDFSEPTRIRLPKLKRIHSYRCNVTLLSAILERLDLPEGGVSIEISEWLPEATTMRSFIPARFITHWSGMKEPLTTLDATFDDFAVTATTRTSAFNFRYPSGHGRDTMLADLQHIFPLFSLTTLYIWGHCLGSPSWTSDAWRRILGELTSVTDLMLTLLEDHAQVWLINLLRSQPEVWSYPVPMLRVLRVAVPLSDDELATLLNVLTERNDSGHRLKTLHIVSDANYSGGYDSEEQLREGLENWLEEMRLVVDEIRFEVMTQGYVFDAPVPSYYELYPSLEFLELVRRMSS